MTVAFFAVVATFTNVCTDLLKTRFNETCLQTGTESLNTNRNVFGPTSKTRWATNSYVVVQFKI